MLQALLHTCQDCIQKPFVVVTEVMFPNSAAEIESIVAGLRQYSGRVVPIDFARLVGEIGNSAEEVELLK